MYDWLFLGGDTADSLNFFLSVYLYFKHILQLKYISFCNKAKSNLVLRMDHHENGSKVSSVILSSCHVSYIFS